MDAVYRSTCRAQVTKLCNIANENIKTFKTMDLADASESASVESELVVLAERLKNARSNLKAADEVMRNSIKPEDQVKECETILEYDDKAVTTIAQLEHILRIHFKAASAGSDKETNATQDVPTTEASGYSGVRLKAFELKKFNGDFENWLPFWEQFKRAVHENKQLSAAAKFTYLSEALVGKAAASISGFTPTEKCYKEAISLLQEEYGNHEKIVERFVQKLMNINPIQSAGDVQGLRQLYNNVSSTMRSLIAFQIAPSQYNIMVKSILLKAIPSSMRVQYYRGAEKGSTSSTLLNSSIDTVNENLKNTGTESEQLSDILAFIKREVEALEKSQLSQHGKNFGNQASRELQSRGAGTAAGLFTSNNTTPGTYQQCVFCGKNSHKTKDCISKLTIDQKKSALRREGRCFRCANTNHNSKFCKAQWIMCGLCGGRHITSMCERQQRRDDKQYAERQQQRDGKQYAENQQRREKPNDQRTSSSTTAGAGGAAGATALNTVGASEAQIFLQTAKAIVSEVNNSESVVSRLIMDNGSQRTYVTEKLVKQLNLPTAGYEKMQIMAFGSEDKTKKVTKFKNVDISLRSQYSDNVIVIKAIVVPVICADILPVPRFINKKFKHIQMKLADCNASNEKLVDGINILIGQDYYWKFNTGEFETIERNIVAVKTFFGWTLQGQREKYETDEVCSYAVNLVEARPQTFNIANFWNLESIGITNCHASEESLLEKTVSEIRQENGRYVVNLPWKNIPEKLNCNKDVAIGRLSALTNKLLKNRNRLLEYDRGMSDLLQDGIAERVIDTATSQRLYYMPHKPVYREDKTTTKMRIVFDASSSEPGFLSLNDHLSAGDNLVADLLKILIRFRSNKIAIIADIEKAFLQIAIAERDRNSHRFLWYESLPQINERLPKMVEYRMTRVTFGNTSSPFMLAATIRKHLEMSKLRYGAVCDKLKKSFYVDDLVLSERTSEEAKKTFLQANEIMGAAKFNLRKWKTNDVDLRRYFQLSEHDEAQSHKVLGVNWCTASDEISADIANCSEFIKGLRATKRNVITAMAKIYDPLGMLGPFTVRIKIILQNIWKANWDWDKTLSGDVMNDFQCWQDELDSLREFKFKRCLSPCSNSKNEIHIFADASPKAYGAVAYIRQISTNGIITTNFICSKNRVSPIEKNQTTSELTLPKLELTAALIAARLKQFLMESLDFEIKSTTLWTDSAIALNWINGLGKQLKPYVKARVHEINKLTNIYDWRHCQGKMNPADLLTRGVKANVLAESTLWKHGPVWLSEDEMFWPAEFIVERSANLLANVIEESNESERESIMDLEKFSQLKRLLRVTAFIFRFIQNLKCSVANKNQHSPKQHSEISELSAHELEEAESYWIRQEQRKQYSRECKALANQRSIPSDSKIGSLNPILINGILRLSSRLPTSENGNRNPIILPKHSHFSKLVVWEAHRHVLHCGINSVLAHIRRRFWVIQARQLIKSVLRHCVVCKRLHGKGASETWTTLPIERVATSRPFETTGVDFAGPLYVKAEDESRQRKVYIMLLTCAAIRAVHLELVPDLSTKSCIDALRRFIARRGVPATIISDNAKTFKRADLELRKLSELMTTSEVQQLAAHQKIVWKFIPERAAWWGGFWERLVRSVKDCLKAAIGKANLNVDDLTTLLAEVESVVNARPLTYITSDHTDLEPLTPSHFLTNSVPSLLQTDFKSDGSSIAKSWELRQSIIKRYIKRWCTEYLAQLRTIHHNKKTRSHSVSVGDVVLVHEDNKPRLFWKLAVVQRTYQGRDGRIRACDIRLQNQQVLKRPIQLLYPLEISSAMPGAEDVEN